MPAARPFAYAPEVRENFDDMTLGRFPDRFQLDGYDARWIVTDYGRGFGKIVTAQDKYSEVEEIALSHLVYTGSTSRITGGRIPSMAKYYVEALIHVKEVGSQHSNEHTVQAYWRDGNYNIEALIYGGGTDQAWSILLYGNGYEDQFDKSYSQRAWRITKPDGTPQIGWDWWGRLGLEIDRQTKKITVYFNGLPIPSLTNVTNTGINTTDNVYTTMRATNERMDFDDFRIYLLNQGVSTIQASAGAGGAISPSGFVEVASGTNKTFNITPNTGYDVAAVYVDNVSQGPISSYTFSNVTGDHFISASFYKQGDLPPILDGLVGYYRFAGNTLDSSGHNNNAFCSGAGCPASVADQDGIAAQAAYFNGSQQLSIPNSTSLEVSTNVTVAAHVKINGLTGDYQEILLKSWAYSLWINPQGYARGAGGFNGAGWVDVNDSSVPLNDGRWHHLAYVYDGSALRIYVDGIPRGSTPLAAQMISNTSSLDVGGYRFAGSLDDLRVYNRALSAPEIYQLSQTRG